MGYIRNFLSVRPSSHVSFTHCIILCFSFPMSRLFCSVSRLSCSPRHRSGHQRRSVWSNVWLLWRNSLSLRCTFDNIDNKPTKHSGSMSKSTVTCEMLKIALCSRQAADVLMRVNIVVRWDAVGTCCSCAVYFTVSCILLCYIIRANYYRRHHARPSDINIARRHGRN